MYLQATHKMEFALDCSATIASAITQFQKYSLLLTKLPKNFGL